jgi:beta-glucosidase
MTALMTGCASRPTSEVGKIDDLLKQMTIEEKIGQMNQYSGFFDPTGPPPRQGNSKDKYSDIKNGLVGAMLNVRGAEAVRALQKLAVEGSRLGIPMLFGYDVIHGHQTIMPIPLAEAASWDLEAIERSARVSAIEASAQGINWTFAPMVDISRDARWGRVMEGAGEDPFLGSRIAEARINGFQGDDLADHQTLATCAKHFAAYGFIEAGREYNKVDIGGLTLWNTVFPPFIASIHAGVSTVMNAFNEVNGTPSTADKWLHREVLKEKWGFDGFVVSDWGTIGELIVHGRAADEVDAAQLALNAGCDMDMESHIYTNHLKKAVEDGLVDEATIDDGVRRILQLKKDLGLFEDPYRYCDKEREEKLLGHPDHQKVALEMARKSMVLLKNEDLLPLSRSGKSVGVIGHLAQSKNSPLGSWRLGSIDHSAVSILEGLDAVAGFEYEYAKGVELFSGEEKFIEEIKINDSDPSGIAEAVDLARRSDVVIMVLGEHGFQSGEARSRADIGLPGLQQDMLEAVYEVNQNIVLVLMNGRPLAIPWAAEHIPAILEAWQPGIQGGHAIASVLFGDYNPSGKLPITFPRSVGQVPIYYGQKRGGRPERGNDVFWSHYMDEVNEPLWPFGHGLSYTTFEYDVLEAEEKKGKLEVSVTVTNSGDRQGEEVVQLYMRDPVATYTRPIKELKGFEKVLLEAGESKTVTFTLDESHLGYFDPRGNWLFEPGIFEIMVNHLNTQVHYKGQSFN